MRSLIWVFGFLVGMRLSDQDRGFLDAAAVSPGMSNDVLWCGDSLQAALSQSDAFFLKHASNRKVETAIRAVIHSYLLATNPTLLDFERFIYLYTALEAAFTAYTHVHGKTAFNQGKLVFLCDSLKVKKPDWVANKAFLFDPRNETLHEGLFFGKPWGFGTFGGSQSSTPEYATILHQLQNLLCRIVLALLDLRDEAYLQSAVDDRQVHGIHLS